MTEELKKNFTLFYYFYSFLVVTKVYEFIRNFTNLPNEIFLRKNSTIIISECCIPSLAAQIVSISIVATYVNKCNQYKCGF